MQATKEQQNLALSNITSSSFVSGLGRYPLRLGSGIKTDKFLNLIIGLLF